MALTFKIGGRSMTLEPDQVIRSLAGVEPEPIRSHAVDVQGTLYPTKQAFQFATGLDRLDFTTNQARTQFRRLGFKVVRVGTGK